MNIAKAEDKNNIECKENECTTLKMSTGLNSRSYACYVKGTIHVIGDNSEDSCLNWFSSLSHMFTEQRESLRHSRRHSIHSAKNNSFCNRGTGSLTCSLARSLLHRTRRDARKKVAKEAREKNQLSNIRDIKSVGK